MVLLSPCVFEGREMNEVRALNRYVEKDTYGFFEDFDWLISPHLWTTTLTDSGSATVANGTCGIVPLLPSDGSVADNDETYLGTTNAPVTFADGKPAFCEFLVQFSEANTDDANVFVGFSSSISANILVDDGAGMATSFSGACIYKVDGGTVWKCITSNGSTQTISTSTTTAGGSSYQRLRIEVMDFNSTTAEVVFYVNNVPLKDSNGIVISHKILYSGLSACKVAMGVKNGGANQETFNVDYATWAQRRGR